MHIQARQSSSNSRLLPLWARLEPLKLGALIMCQLDTYHLPRGHICLGCPISLQTWILSAANFFLRMF